MPIEKATKAVTFIEAVKESLAAAGRYNSGDSLPPAAILWTDADGEWQPIVTRLRALMPELLTLGEYEPEQRTGPAIWLRCIVDGALPDVQDARKVRADFVSAESEPAIVAVAGGVS